MGDQVPESTPQAIVLRDSLTGAYTRALLEERLGGELGRAERQGQPLALCMIDLDYLKSVNDAYGHQRGDAVLVELVRRINGLSRGEDALFRFGGDEFILLLPNTTNQQATVLAKRLLAAVRDEPFAGNPPLHVSVSIGIASYPEDAKVADTLFSIADLRQYAAKRQGRGTIVGSHSPPGPPSAQDESGSRLIERDEAQALLYSFLASLAERSPGLARVLGPPGIGRSRFLLAAADAARLRGFAVAVLRGKRSLKSLPLSALERAEWQGVNPPAQIDDAWAEALWPLIRAQGRQGLLLVIDDCHDLDRATVAALNQLLAGPSLALGLVCAASPSDGPALNQRALRLRRTIELRPLSLEGVRIWLRGVLHWEPPPEFLEWFHRETAGRPALIKRGIAALISQQMLVQSPERRWTLRTDYMALALGAQLGAWPSQPPHNLPATLTEFIGRERECAQVSGLLERSRLVTLVGSAGIGKTRLALEIANDLHLSFAHGVWFVTLAAIHTPELMISAIAMALGLKEVADQPLMERLKGDLQHKRALLVLDNFEQITAGAPLLNELLAAAPQLRIVVTSRQVLHMHGEQKFNVPALPLPPASPPLNLMRLEQCASVALFVARAQAANVEFSLHADNAAEVAQLCRQLEGVPLAIELAAARSSELTPMAMLAAMQNRLEWLTGGPRDMPLRQQTLRNAIDWSYSLLEPHEQAVFNSLAVFAGGFTVEAAQAVQGMAVSPATGVEQALLSLVDKSLLAPSIRADTAARFAMLGTIRDYARERLARQADAGDLRSRHGWYYAALAQEAEPQLKGAQQQQCIARLKPELDNVRQALRWSRDHDHRLLAELCSAIWRLWSFGGQLSEGSGWLADALARRDSVPPAIQANLYHGFGLTAWMRGEYPQARAAFSTALAMRQALGDEAGSALMYNNLGHLAMIDDELDEATRLLELALAIQRRLGDVWGSAYAIINLGSVALRQQRYERAAAFYRESLDLRRTLNDQRGMAGSLGNLGWVALCQGQDQQALDYFAESMGLFQSQDNLIGIAETLAGMAEVAAIRQDWQRAARLSGASQTVYETIGARLWPDIGTPYERHLAAMQERRSTAEFAASWLEGCAMPMEQAIAYALDGAAGPPKM